MPIRKATQSITLVRKDKRIEIKPGQEFDFTEDEIADIAAVSADALSTVGTVDLTEGEAAPKKAPKKAAATSGDL